MPDPDRQVVTNDRLKSLAKGKKKMIPNIIASEVDEGLLIDMGSKNDVSQQSLSRSARWKHDKTKWLHAWLCLAVITAWAGSSTQAAPIVEWTGTQATAIRDFQFDGRTYDVTFDSRSFEAITSDLSLSDPFPFIGSEADTVSDVLSDVNALLNETPALRLFDFDTGFEAARGMIVSSDDAAGGDQFFGLENQFFGTWRIAPSGGGVSFGKDETATSRNRAFMVFHAVPEPSSLGLLALGAISLMGRRKRQRA